MNALICRDGFTPRRKASLVSQDFMILFAADTRRCTQTETDYLLDRPDRTKTVIATRKGQVLTGFTPVRSAGPTGQALFSGLNAFDSFLPVSLQAGMKLPKLHPPDGGKN